MSEKSITFEDLPKAMSWMMDKLNELDSKIDGLNNHTTIVICIVYQHITYPYIKNSSTNSNLVDYAI